MAETIAHAQSAEPTSWEIAVYALMLCEGHMRKVATEDIAVKCFEPAPDSFSWIKYPHFPDKDIVRIALTDARKTDRGKLVSGRAGRGKGQSHRTRSTPETDGWELTADGAKWINSNSQRIADALGHKRALSNRQEDRRRVSSIRNHPTVPSSPSCSP